MYGDVLNKVKEHLEGETTLEQDEKLFESTSPAEWQMRMALIYRIDRKRILESQFEILNQVKGVLRGTQTVIQDTEKESLDRAGLEGDSEALRKFERQWLHRRLVNAKYYQSI